MPFDTNIEVVRILNSENDTQYYQYIRRNRLQAFYQFLMTDRHLAAVPVESSMPGLSGLAIQGLDAIFDRRPRKFPVADILLWLRDCQLEYSNESPNPPITVLEIENTLERFSKVYPPDVCASEDK